MQNILFLLLAIVAGAVLPIQAAVNTKLGDAVKDPIYGTFISFIVGIVFVGLYFLSGRANLSNISYAFEQHWSIWIGGALGAFYVTALILLTPRLGVALTFGLTVAGQMGFALIMDHYGWWGLPVQPINWGKIAGITLVIGGVWLLRSF